MKLIWSYFFSKVFRKIFCPSLEDKVYRRSNTMRKSDCIHYTDWNIKTQFIVGFAEQDIYCGYFHQLGLLRSFKKNRSWRLKTSRKTQGKMDFWDQVQKDMIETDQLVSMKKTLWTKYDADDINVCSCDQVPTEVQINGHGSISTVYSLYSFQSYNEFYCFNYF